MAFAVKSTVRAHGPRAASSLVAPRTGSYSQARSIRCGGLRGAGQSIDGFDLPSPEDGGLELVASFS
jgi:hypothetical protein